MLTYMLTSVKGVISLPYLTTWGRIFVHEFIGLLTIGSAGDKAAGVFEGVTV